MTVVACQVTTIPHYAFIEPVFYTEGTYYQLADIGTGDGQGMPLSVPLLGEDLRRAGYSTHMIGKVRNLLLFVHSTCD